ncbi:cytochrome b/b6 domain-containing protein [Haliea sp. E1-2-M8]|uniref:cytochrome b/b6 domain-containing protein n=1 Tax=Haliea sp. E1-2-M8 TaxID=3064706 RepID=UPI0027175D2E|nr:cytochrome b/b6 domain-containing protein [Haliea sp. E1-2-M8]MDO8860791.1 cytochrome b/b6 domain-containing protein [Haliea sp. E1-2-M8]
MPQGTDAVSRNAPHPLWDWPTRLFHWALVVLLPLAWWTAEEGQMERHQWVGYTVIVLVVFRICWGFVGSPHSRFRDFLRGPGTVLGYVRGRVAPGPGHNPLGGWSVIVLLTLLLVQAGSGLFNSDQILFDGPFYYAVSSDTRDFLGVVHEWAFDALLAMVVLHLLAIAWHQFRRREKLVQAMLKGTAEGKQGVAAPAPWWLAPLLLVVVIAAGWWLLQQAPPPPRMW